MTEESIIVQNTADGRVTRFPFEPHETIRTLVEELARGGFVPSAPDGYRIVLQPLNRELCLTQSLADLAITPDSRLSIEARGEAAIRERYSATVGCANPMLILFVIDRSGSMAEEFDGAVSRAALVADDLNRSMMALIMLCADSERIYDRFDVGVICYSGADCGPGFGGALAGSHIWRIGEVARSPLRIETRKRTVADGVGGLLEIERRFPIWFEPHAAAGAPMCRALRLGADILADWCRDHPCAFPPVVVHVTGGEVTDGTEADVVAAAERVTSARTDDGAALLLNVHVARAGCGEPVRFPVAEDEVSGNEARMLFRVSSVMPPVLLERTIEAARPGSRGYSRDIGLEEIMTLFETDAPRRFSSPGSRECNLA